MRHEVDHGSQPLSDWLFSGFAGMPIVAVVRTRVELDNETQGDLAGAPDRFPPLSIETRLRASGVRESSLDLPPFRLVREDAERALEARFEGLSGTMVSTGAFGDLAGSFQSRGLHAQGPLGALRVAELAWVVDFGREAHGLPVGEAVARLGLFELTRTGAAEPPLRFSNLELEQSQSSAVQQGLLEARVEARIDLLDVAGRRFGPGSLSLAVHRVDAKSAARVREALRGARPPAALTPPDADSEEAAAQALAALPLAALLEVLPALAARSPELELAGLRLETPEGEIHASARVAIDGSRPELLQSPLTLPAALEGSFEISVPAALVDALVPPPPESQQPGTSPPLPPLAALRQRGIVILDGQRYRSRGEWREARLTLNGLPLAMADLVAPLLSPGEPGADAGADPTPALSSR
jgi:uncharacterized protein YdgA (DUF945 family)